MMMFDIAEGSFKVRRPSEESSQTDKDDCVKRRLDFVQKHNKRLRLQDDSKSKQTSDKSFLDMFLGDLVELEQIPFFDSEMPRELAVKIFKHLDVVSLCRCAQASKAWKSLAEDELLWCLICQKLGYEEPPETITKTNWKHIVRDHICQERKLRQNWKERIADMSSLEVTQAGILCAASSWKYQVATAYTTGEVHVWDLNKDSRRKLDPSSTSLALDENEEFGTTRNLPTTVCLNESFIATAYSHGNVDIWSCEGENSSPVFTMETRRCLNQNKLDCSQTEPVLAAAVDNSVWIYKAAGTGLDKPSVQQFNLNIGSMVSMVRFVLKPPRTRGHHVVAAGTNQAVVYEVGSDPQKRSTLHHVIQQEVSYLDCSSNEAGLAISAGHQYFVKLYDLSCCKETVKLTGHTDRVGVLNLQDSPPHSLVTGCWDSRVRVYDTRSADPVTVFPSSWITSVQMDEWKIVVGCSPPSGPSVSVWDQRMVAELWSVKTRHPARYVNFIDHFLLTAAIPDNKAPGMDTLETVYHKRLRGGVTIYDFSIDPKVSEDVPSNALSTYDAPEGYNFNINLAVPYSDL